MARKKSKGSKKARARKARAKKSAEVEAPASTPTEAELEAPAESSADPTVEPVGAGEAPSEESAPSVTPKKKAAKQPTSDEEGAAEKTPKKKAGKKKTSDKEGAAEKTPKKKTASKKKAASKKKPEKAASAAKRRSGNSKAAAPVVTAPEEAPTEEPVVLDDVDEDLADLVAAATATDDDIVTITIDPDDDLDDADARERLIAEALAFVATEEGEAVPENAPSVESTAPSEAPGSGDAIDPETASTDLDEDTAAPPSTASPDEEGASDAADSGGPKITAQALLALSEIHAEGLASLPEELILDLGEATTSEQRDRLLAAALAQVEMQDAVYRVSADTSQTRNIKAGIAIGVLLIAALVGIRPPGLLVPDPPASLTQADRTQGVRVALLLQAQQVEAFRVQAGRLPNSIAEVETSLPGIRLVKSSNRLYQLIAYTSEGEPIVYDSEVPAPEFERLRREWSTTRDGS